MYLTFCTGGLAGHRIELTPGRLQVGRSSKNDVTLSSKDTTASGTHAVLEHVEGRWFVRDERSTTGTFVNGLRLQPATTHPLSAGDWIMFGASGATALMQESGSEPPRSWLVAEPSAYPGRFLAFADVTSAQLSVDRDGLLRAESGAAGNARTLTVELDCNPIRYRRGQDPAQACAPGDVIEVGREATEVRLLGARGAPRAASVGTPLPPSPHGKRAGIGERTLMQAVKGSARKHRNLTLLLSGLLLVSVALVGHFVLGDLDRQRVQDRAEVQNVSSDIEDVSSDLEGVSSGIDEAVREVATSREERDRLTRDLSVLAQRLSANLTQQRKELEAEFRRQQEEARKANARASKNERERFAALLERYKRSVFLIYSETRVGGQLVQAGWGTGWMATSDGLLVTNKHVVQGWKFDLQIQHLLGRRPDLRPQTTVYAWPGGGTRFLDSSGDPPNKKTAYCTARGSGASMRLVGVGDDSWGWQMIEQNGQPVRVRIHAGTDGDLAVLRLTGGPFVHLPIRDTPVGLKELTPIMLLGFPLGNQILDSGRTDLSACLGTIRFVSSTINHTAPAHGGNSGGPLITLDGKVIGVMTRGPKETVNSAIRSDHVLRLLKKYR